MGSDLYFEEEFAREGDYAYLVRVVGAMHRKVQKALRSKKPIKYLEEMDDFLNQTHKAMKNPSFSGIDRRAMDKILRECGK